MNCCVIKFLGKGDHKDRMGSAIGLIIISFADWRPFPKFMSLGKDYCMHLHYILQHQLKEHLQSRNRHACTFCLSLGIHCQFPWNIITFLSKLPPNYWVWSSKYFPWNIFTFLSKLPPNHWVLSFLDWLHNFVPTCTHFTLLLMLIACLVNQGQTHDIWYKYKHKYKYKHTYKYIYNCSQIAWSIKSRHMESDNRLALNQRLYLSFLHQDMSSSSSF